MIEASRVNKRSKVLSTWAQYLAQHFVGMFRNHPVSFVEIADCEGYNLTLETRSRISIHLNVAETNEIDELGSV